MKLRKVGEEKQSEALQIFEVNKTRQKCRRTVFKLVQVVNSDLETV